MISREEVDQIYRDRGFTMGDYGMYSTIPLPQVNVTPMAAKEALPTATPTATTEAVNTDPYIPLGSQSDGGVKVSQGFRVPFSIPSWAWLGLAAVAVFVVFRKFGGKKSSSRTRGKKT